MKILKASPKAAAVRNELLRCVRNFEGPASDFEVNFNCKLGLKPVRNFPVGFKLDYRLGSGFKIAKSLQILLFLNRNPKPFN